MFEFLSFFSFFFKYLSSPNLGLTPPGSHNPNARESDACRGSNCLWTRTLDRYIRAGLPECVVSTMSGLPPKTARQITDKGKTPNPRIGKKIPDPAGNRTRAAGLEGRDSTDHVTATGMFEFKGIHFLCFDCNYLRGQRFSNFFEVGTSYLSQNTSADHLTLVPCERKVIFIPYLIYLKIYVYI